MRNSLLLLLAALAVFPLSAQQTIRWQANGRVRRARIGALESVNPDTLPGLERRVGGRFSRGRNTLIGLGVGLVFGGVAGYASGDDQCTATGFGCFFAFSAGDKAALGAITGGLVGVLVGAILVPAARWIPWNGAGESARVQPTTTIDRYGKSEMGIRISF